MVRITPIYKPYKGHVRKDHHGLNTLEVQHMVEEAVDPFSPRQNGGILWLGFMQFERAGVIFLLEALRCPGGLNICFGRFPFFF